MGVNDSVTLEQVLPRCCVARLLQFVKNEVCFHNTSTSIMFQYFLVSWNDHFLVDTSYLKCVTSVLPWSSNASQITSWWKWSVSVTYRDREGCWYVSSQTHRHGSHHQSPTLSTSQRDLALFLCEVKYKLATMTFTRLPKYAWACRVCGYFCVKASTWTFNGFVSKSIYNINIMLSFYVYLGILMV